MKLILYALLSLLFCFSVSAGIKDVPVSVLLTNTTLTVFVDGQSAITEFLPPETWIAHDVTTTVSTSIDYPENETIITIINNTCLSTSINLSCQPIVNFSITCPELNYSLINLTTFLNLNGSNITIESCTNTTTVFRENFSCPASTVSCPTCPSTSCPQAPACNCQGINAQDLNTLRQYFKVVTL